MTPEHQADKGGDEPSSVRPSSPAATDSTSRKSGRKRVIRGHWIVLTKGVLLLGIGLFVGVSAELDSPVIPNDLSSFWESLSLDGLAVLGGQLVATILLFFGVIEMLIECSWLATSTLTLKQDGLEWRTGFIREEIAPIKYSDIESVALYRTLLGRTLNYGTLKIYGVGSGSILIPNIKNATALHSFINKAKSKKPASHRVR